MRRRGPATPDPPRSHESGSSDADLCGSPQSGRNIPPAQEAHADLNTRLTEAPHRSHKLSLLSSLDADGPTGGAMNRAASIGRSFAPGEVLLRTGRGNDDPHLEHAGLRGQAAVPVRRGVHRPVPLRAAALLVPAADLHRRLRLRRPGPAGGQRLHALRHPRPARRLLRARLDPRVRALRDRRRRRRRRRHRDHRRPRRPQDPRGARRPAGARRRPDQEPGRAALPGADADHRPARHLRPGLRDQRRHPRPRSSTASRSAGSSRRSSRTPRSPTSPAR